MKISSTITGIISIKYNKNIIYCNNQKSTKINTKRIPYLSHPLIKMFHATEKMKFLSLAMTHQMHSMLPLRSLFPANDENTSLPRLVKSPDRPAHCNGYVEHPYVRPSNSTSCFQCSSEALQLHQTDVRLKKSQLFK